MHDNETRQREQLRQAEDLAAMGKAVSFLAHDMKAPLVAIGGFASQLRRKTGADDPAGKKLDLILSQTERLETMIRDMLSFARPLELQKRAIDVNELAEESLEVEEAAATRGLGLRMEADEGLPPVRVDRNRLQQVLLNLISNAVEASPAGEMAGVRTARHEPGAVIEITDHGPGLPAGERQQVFNPFTRPKRKEPAWGCPS